MVVDEHDAALHARPPRQRQLDLGALAGRRRDRRAAAGALHPALDRLGEPAPVRRHGGAVEAGAAVADEDGDASVRRPRRRRRSRRRPRTWRRSSSPRARRARVRTLVGRAVAGARELDAHAVQLLDVGGRRRRARRRATRCRRRAAGRRRASRAARAPAGARATRRAAAPRVPLDQRERLQHRVVHARRDLGALVAADARGALRVASSASRQSHGPAIEQQRAGDRARREQRRRRAAALAAAARRRTPASSEAAVRERRARPEAAALAPARARSPPATARCRRPPGPRGRAR